MTMILITLLAGILAGILSGLLGVGGGLILIPIMVFLLGIPQHAAQGISLLVIIPTAIAAIWQLHKANLVNYTLAMHLALGSIIGALISSNLVQYVPSDRLKLIFGIFIIFMGIRTILGSLKSK
jgi:uncharacterized membrane protein YfcA